MIAKDTKVKVSEEPASADGVFNLESILSELGSFGKYQLLLLLLLAFRDSFLSMCNFNYVFTAVEVAQRCYVPECDVVDDSFNASWAAYALPNDTGACFRMAAAPHAHALLSRADNHTQDWHNQSCSPEYFEVDHVVPCDRIIYEDYNSIVAEFDLGCQPWKRTLIGTVHNLGLVFSFVLSGFISDRYGRKVIIVGSPLMVAAAGLVKSFSVNYWMLLVFEFLETALGYGNASMVLSLETVSQSRRAVFLCIWDILSSIGSSFFALIAWKIPYWRSMMRAIYAPLLVTVFYIFLVDEGVRWLLAHNKRDEAVRVLNKVAKYNNVTLSTKAKDMLTSISKQRDQISKESEQSKQKEKPGHLMRALQSRKTMMRLALVAAMFFCSTFVFNGTIINSVSISGNKYINFAALKLSNIPTRIITAFTLTRYGRKTPISISYLLCALFFITSALVPKSLSWSALLLYLAGKMASSYGTFALWVVAMEVFPTTTRNSLINLANIFGRVGGVLAPQTPLLERYMTGLASVMFGVAALGPALLAMLLPDTSHVALPDDVAEAERIDEAARRHSCCKDSHNADSPAPPAGDPPHSQKQVVRF